MPSMPSGFRPITQSYSQGSPGGVMRTEVAGGFPRYGLDWDRGLTQFQCTLILSSLEFSVWSAWFHQVIKKGAITFDMPLDSGFGVQAHACNIVPGSYSAARVNGPVTSVSFVVEAESKAYELAEDDAAALVSIFNTYGALSSEFLDALAEFANVHLDVLDF